MLLSRLCLDGRDRSAKLQSHHRKRDIPADELVEEPELSFAPRSPTAHRHAASSTEGVTSDQDPQSTELTKKNTAGFATVTAVFVSPAQGEPLGQAAFRRSRQRSFAFSR